MTYYYLFVIFFMVLAFLAVAIKNKTLPQFAKATVVCLIAAALGIAINSTNLYHTWQYQKESMRGKSELASKTDPSNQTVQASTATISPNGAMASARHGLCSFLTPRAVPPSR